MVRNKHRKGLQFAALPVVKDAQGKLHILLITSRETRRWIIPKGWADEGLKGPEVAAKEALEEAGIIGAVYPRPLGTYSYDKRLERDAEVACLVEVYRLDVHQCHDEWLEKDQRERRWFPIAEAIELVRETELAAIIARLD